MIRMKYLRIRNAASKDEWGSKKKIILEYKSVYLLNSFTEGMGLMNERTVQLLGE